MSKQSVKTTIDANIKQNGNQEITGQILNSVLNQMVDNLAEEASTTAKLSELDQKIGMIEIPTTKQYYYLKINGGVGSVVPINSPTPGGNFRYMVYPCTEGDYIIVNGKGGSSARLWAFADANNVILAVADADAVASSLKLTAPQGTAYVVINDDSGKLSYFLKPTSLENTKADKSALESEIATVYRSSTRQFKYDLSAESFINSQRCIFHDNFFRERTTWKIGDNTNYAIMRYYSPRTDYATIDDGFRIVTTFDTEHPTRIVSGVLTNNQSVSISKAYRLITDSENLLNEAFFVELSVPSIGKYAEFVYDYVDDTNYKSIEIVSASTGVSVYLNDYAKATHTAILTTSFVANAVKLAFADNQIRIYFDDTDMYQQMTAQEQEIINYAPINKALPIGLAISNAHSYEYRSLAIYNIGGKVNYTSERIANGIPNGMELVATKPYQYTCKNILRVCGVGSTLPVASQYGDNAFFVKTDTGVIYINTGSNWMESDKALDDYAMLIDVYNNKVYSCDNGVVALISDKKQDYLPKRVQRFEIRAIDVTDSASARVELVENVKTNYNYLNLRKRHIRFKTFLPFDYLANDGEGGEALLQFQSSTEGGMTRGPIFTIASSVIGSEVRYHTNRRNIPTRPVAPNTGGETIFGEDDIDLGVAKLGEWEDWDIYFKEGYMPEHTPLAIIKRNGIEVYRSPMPNMYNITFGSYIRYGIYKSVYVGAIDKTRKRIVYIADFQYES